MEAILQVPVQVLGQLIEKGIGTEEETVPVKVKAEVNQEAATEAERNLKKVKEKIKRV